MAEGDHMHTNVFSNEYGKWTVPSWANNKDTLRLSEEESLSNKRHLYVTSFTTACGL